MTRRTEENLKKTANHLGLTLVQMPRNVAIIMDGNGRWAQKRGLARAEGHCEGGRIVERVTLDCVDVGIESLILYSFSSENWSRPKAEIDVLMSLYTKYIIDLRPMMMENGVKLIHLGQINGLPQTLIYELAKSMEMTADNDGLVLGLALNYSGRVEIEDVVKKIALEFKDGKICYEDIGQRFISEHIYAPQIGETDLLIRTSGEMRISNFLLWQIAYAELYFTNVLWPDFKRTDIEEAIITYSQRERRFGNLGS